MEIDDTKFINLIRDKIPNLIDSQLEKDVNLMKEINIMGYFLEMLELSKQNPLPIEQLILVFAQQKFHVQQGINNKIRSFITILLYSFLKKSNNSQDLSYVKRFFIQKKSNASVAFYLKLRKTIITNFSYNSRTQMLDGLNLKFDDWSTLTTRFLGAEAISQIGAKVKEVNSKTKVYDKILTNSIDAVFFVTTCVDIFESREKPQQLQKEKRSQSQNSQKSENSNSQNLSQNQIDEEEQIEEAEQNSMIEHEPEEIQGQIEISLGKNPPSKVKQFPMEQKEVQNSQMQQKLIVSLQETKYQLLEAQRSSQEAVERGIGVFEKVLIENETLYKQNKKQQQLITNLMEKLKSQGINLSEQDKKVFQEIQQFKLQQTNFKEEFAQTGIYKHRK